MSKRRNRENRGEKRRKESGSLLSPELHLEADEIKHRGSKEPIKPKTDNQAAYLNSIQHNNLTFALGPAGTGKTYIAAAHAADLLREKKIEKFIITRPAVEAGESLGFLPGEMEEKFEPYFAPVRDILAERLGSGHLEALLRNKRIEVKPLAFMRGSTFKNAFVLLDEAQNTTPAQMKLFLSRIGEHAKLSVNGDLKQMDIRGKSGLYDAVQRCSHINQVGVIRFDRSDIVRSGIAQAIVEAYEDGHDAEEEGAFENVPAFLKA